MNGKVGSESVAVFGGSGKVGQELVRTLLRRGYRVKALYRPGSEPKSPPAGLEVNVGLLTNPEDVRKTLEGTVGAICVFGPRLGRSSHPEPFCEEATATIASIMSQLGIRRLIVQTGAMAGGDSSNWSWFVRRFAKSYRRDYPKIYKDRDAQEVVVRSSGLDWTIVRPFRISGGKGTGRVRALENVRISFFTHTPRVDLAEFLANELVDRSHDRKTIYAVK